MLATETETKEQIKIREREGGRRGGNTGVLMYSGRGVVSMRGREGQRERKKGDKEGTGKGICEELKKQRTVAAKREEI